MVYHVSITMNHEINNRLLSPGTPVITHNRATILWLFCFYCINITFNFFHFILQILIANLISCGAFNIQACSRNCIDHCLIVRTTISCIKWYCIVEKEVRNGSSNFFNILRWEHAFDWFLLQWEHVRINTTDMNFSFSSGKTPPQSIFDPWSWRLWTTVTIFCITLCLSPCHFMTLS